MVAPQNLSSKVIGGLFKYLQNLTIHNYPNCTIIPLLDQPRVHLHVNAQKRIIV